MKKTMTRKDSQKVESIPGQLQKLLQEELKRSFKVNIEPDQIQFQHPNNVDFGDWSTNMALVLAQQIKKRPVDIAAKLKQSLGLVEIDGAFVTVEVVRPGFLNFWLNQEHLLENLGEIKKKKAQYGHSSIAKGQKILTEYTDPNPFKVLHIGHLHTNAIGEAISRLWEACGAEVKRSNYQGDVGMHVAKSIWGMKRKMADEGLSLADLAKKPLSERVKFLGQSYAYGASVFKTDEKAAEEIRDINYLVYMAAQQLHQEQEGWQPQVDYKQYIGNTKFDFKEIKELYKHGRQWTLEDFERIYQRVDTKFDFYFFESKVGEYGYKFVKDYLKKGVFKESKGAIIYEGKKQGLHNRVFINSLGLPVYEAKDLGLSFMKYESYKYDKSYIITANEITEYFKVVLKAMAEINPELAAKTVHLGHGMTKLPQGKMSSRTGKIISGEELLNQIKKEVLEVMAKNKEIEVKKRDEIAEKVALAAYKYTILKTSTDKDVVFDFGQSIDFEGNTGPYLQYTYARCQSVLRKSGKRSVKSNLKSTKGYILKPEELGLLRWMIRFPEVVQISAQKLAPSLLCNYLFDLAQKYNLFYQKVPILKAKNSTEKEIRLAISQATAQILKNGLWMLGIKMVERM